MSLIQVFMKDTDHDEVPGCTVVFAENNRIRCFDPLTDDPEDIVGVVYSKDALYGREVVNGLSFYENSYYLLDPFFDYMQDEYGNLIPNPRDPLIDPWTDERFVFVLTHGIGPILKTNTPHPRWRFRKSNPTDTDVYFIR